METIIRVHKDYDADPFARIDKVPINDPDKSWKALGILVYVLSKPDGWEVNIKDLCNHATDQEKAVRSGIAELEQLKYCRKIKAIDARTKRIKKWLYVFYERPYPGEVQPVQVLEIEPQPDPLPHNRHVEPDPLPQKPQVEKPQVEKPQVENGPPINNIIKQLINKITNESNNNNNGQDPAAAIEKNIIVIPEENKKQYLKLEKRIKNLGWVGSMDEIIKYFLLDPNNLTAWVEKVEKINIDNPAGLLRKGLRSKEIIKTEKQIEREKLASLGLRPDEIEAMT